MRHEGLDMVQPDDWNVYNHNIIIDLDVLQQNNNNSFSNQYMPSFCCRCIFLCSPPFLFVFIGLWGNIHSN